jgi:hypothetical protein
MGAITDLASAGLQFAQGDIAAGQAEVSAKAEEGAGVQRELDRKSRLAEALANQNAASGAGGIAAFEGSPLSVMKEDIRREKTATTRDKFQTQLNALTLRAGGKIAKKQARLGATIGLISGIESTAAAGVTSGAIDLPSFGGGK